MSPQTITGYHLSTFTQNNINCLNISGHVIKISLKSFVIYSLKSKYEIFRITTRKFTIIYQSHHANDQWLILGNADGDFNAL